MSRFPDLTVDMMTLSLLGINRISVEDIADEGDIALLLEDIRLTDCDHSWNFFTPRPGAGILEQLREKENSYRPTHFFFYYAEFKDGSRRIIGAGTVAESINRSFAVDGFPVLARAVVLRDFRDKRLYFPILVQRLKFCIDHFGPRLKAVHMGSSNSRIFKAIRYKVFNLPFVYVGNEMLDNKAIVRDFLWLTDPYKQATEAQLLDQALRVDAEGEALLAKLTNSVFRLLANQFDETGFNELATAYYALPEKFRPHFVGELVAFCEVIPVIKAETRTDPVFDDTKLPVIRASAVNEP